jgi:hypothetical protein
VCYGQLAQLRRLHLAVYSLQTVVLGEGVSQGAVSERARGGVWQEKREGGARTREHLSLVDRVRDGSEPGLYLCLGGGVGTIINNYSRRLFYVLP